MNIWTSKREAPFCSLTPKALLYQLQVHTFTFREAWRDLLEGGNISKWAKAEDMAQLTTWIESVQYKQDIVDGAECQYKLILL